MSIDDLIEAAENRVWEKRFAETDLNAHTFCAAPPSWANMSANDILKDLQTLVDSIYGDVEHPRKWWEFPVDHGPKHVLRNSQMSIDSLWNFPVLCPGCGYTIGTGHSAMCPSVSLDTCPPTERIPDPPNALPLKCECGVCYTGGLHSSWCPLRDG